MKVQRKIVRVTVKKNTRCSYCEKKLPIGSAADIYITPSFMFEDVRDVEIYHPNCLDIVLSKKD